MSDLWTGFISNPVNIFVAGMEFGILLVTAVGIAVAEIRFRRKR
jgi:hypothetical protein